MGRYLTPSKVALLCLVYIYADGVVPNASAVHVLSFLVSCLFPLEPSSSREEQQQSIHDFERVLAPESSIPGRSLWDLFLIRIWSINCLDALEVFFSDISSLLERSREEELLDKDQGIEPSPSVSPAAQTASHEAITTGILLSRSSPLGVFVRRAQLEFTRLQFDDTVKLWKSFVKYRLSTYRAWARKNPRPSSSSSYVGANVIDVNLADIGNSSSARLLTRVAYGRNYLVDDGDDDGYDQFVSTKDV